MNTKTWFIVIILIVPLVVILFARQGSDSSREYSEQIPLPQTNTVDSTTPQKDDLIRVTSLKNNQLVDGSLTLTGEARGQWYFEGSFPVRVEDANGKIIGKVVAQAKGEWTTNEYVPFEVFVIFDKPQTPIGFIIFEKDNPSGLSENANELRVPIQFY